MTKVKLLFWALSLLTLFACYLTDVDEESDFEPAYDKLIGCWVSTENIAHIDSSYRKTVKEEPFSSCREICFRKDSTYTVRTKISKKTTTIFRNPDSSNVVLVNDSIVEAYGFEQDSSYVSQWGELVYSGKSKEWIGSKGIPVSSDNGGFSVTIKNNVLYSGDFVLFVSYRRGNFEAAGLYGYRDNKKIAYHRSMQHDNCGNFGTYIDTTKYTLDSLRGM